MPELWIWSTENSGAIHLTTDGRKMKAEGFLLDRNKGSGYNTQQERYSSAFNVV